MKNSENRSCGKEGNTHKRGVEEEAETKVEYEFVWTEMKMKETNEKRKGEREG